ncbi:PIKK family atypical protein kinase [Tritrichomonas foetus]|uniref:non-specific serine/threonine protein kinase n=1 Tax=Tritrichomonas foetus TaxID=1144522 RepID=A0A1J4J9H1_9EUKA|nr:PIKK family atypical protein kinase [Tritrichomonas foetus]|eukprot:OHS95830.1 PIKK family atypical protein kinase [Tritrichomonas foetus]
MNLRNLNIPNSLPDIISVYKQFKHDTFESWCVLKCDDILHVKDEFEKQIKACAVNNDSKNLVRVCIGAMVLSAFSNARLETCSIFLSKIPPPRETAASEFISMCIAKHCNRVKSMGNFLIDLFKSIKDLLQPNRTKVQVSFAKNLLQNLAIFATHAIDSCSNKFYEVLLDAFQNSTTDVRLSAAYTLNDYFKFTRQKQYPQNLFNQALQLVKQPNPKLHSGIVILTTLIDHFPDFFCDRASGLISFAQEASKNDKLLIYPCYFMEIALVPINPKEFSPIAQNIVKHIWPANENGKFAKEFINLLSCILRKCPNVLHEKIDGLIKIIMTLLTNFDESYQQLGSEILLLYMEHMPHQFSIKYQEIASLLMKVRYTDDFIHTFHKVIENHKEIWEEIKPTIGKLLTQLLDERKSTVVVQLISLIPEIPEDCTNSLTQRIQALLNETDLDLKRLVPSAILALAKNQNSLTSVHLGTTLITSAMTSDSWEMRLAILDSFKPPFPSYLAYPQTLENFSVLINDESFKVRRSALRVLGGIAHINPAMIYPMFRRIILDLLFICGSSKSMRVQCDATKCLPIIFSAVPDLLSIYAPVFLPLFMQHMQQQATKAIDGATTNSKSEKPIPVFTIPLSSFDAQYSSISRTPMAASLSASYGNRVPLMSTVSLNVLSKAAEPIPQQQLAEEQMTFFDHIFSKKISINYIKAIGCICRSNFDIIRDNLYDITNLFIKVIRATGQKKVLLATLSTIKDIVDNLDPEEASKIPDLNETLLETGSRLISTKVHAAIFKILGRIGPVAPQVNPSLDNTAVMKESENVNLSMPREDFYVRVVKNNLDFILDDKSEASLHYLAHQALTRTFSTCKKSVNAQRLFNSYVVRLLTTIRSLSTEERPNYFTFVKIILDCPTEWLQPFALQFFQLVEDLWDTENQDDVINLIPKLASSLKDKFSPYIPKIVSMLLDSISSAGSSSSAIDEQKLLLIMRTLTSLSNFAANFVFIIIKQISELVMNPKTSKKVINCSLDAIKSLVQNYDCTAYSSSLFRMCLYCIQNLPSTNYSAYQVLYSLAVTIGSEFYYYGKAMIENNIMTPEMETILSSNQNKLISDFPFIVIDQYFEEKCEWYPKKEVNEDDLNNTIQIQFNVGTNEQWKNWIRTFIRAFILQSPNPAIQSCAQVASKSYLFSRKIFNVAFLSCWSILSPNTRSKIKSIISMPLADDGVPMSVVTVLIGLIEFTERARDPIEDSNNFNRTKAALRAEKPTFALHCAQLDFDSQNTHTSGNVQQLITAYSQLGLYDEVKGTYKVVGDSSFKPNKLENTLSRFEQLEQWEKIAELYPQFKSMPTPEKRQAGLIYAHAFLHLKKWPEFEQSISECPLTPTSIILKCIHNITNGKDIKELIDLGFEKLGSQGGPLFSHGFTAVSQFIVNAQQLVELQEFADKNTSKWESRLDNANCHFNTIRPLLHTRMDLLKPDEQKPVFLSFLKMARKANEWDSHEQFFDLHFSRENYDLFTGYEFLHLLWKKINKDEALKRIDEMIKSPTNEMIYARLFYKKAKWLARKTSDKKLSQMIEVRNLCDKSLRIRSDHYPTQNLWAWACMRVFDSGIENRAKSAVEAISGFARCVKLDNRDSFFDLLQMSSVLFRSTQIPSVFEHVEPIIHEIELKRYTKIIPQLIVYKHTHSKPHRQFILSVLEALLHDYPNSVIFSLLFVQHFGDNDQEICDLMNSFELANPTFYAAAYKVLIGLQNSCLTFTEFIYEGLNNIFADAKENKLEELLVSIPKFLERVKNVNCPYDKHIMTKYRDRIQYAIVSLEDFMKNQKCEQIISACKNEWQKLTKAIITEALHETKISLKSVAPELDEFNFSLLSVFSTFSPDKPVIGISKFCDDLRIKQTKQRPRKLKVIGTDGKTYKFLLKGHEDLRLDQRVMQFFELMNSIASSSMPYIVMTGVTPLTPNVGVIQWVPGCDTMHQLISNYRTISGISPIEVENNMLKKNIVNGTMAYVDNLRPIQRYELFRKVAEKSHQRRLDLRDVMWLNAKDAESWVNHILNFTKTSAQMSIVGYIIGLGDRHPGNIMIQRITGNVVHIDFGDCFEVTKERAQLAETIPFRLTRNMIATLGPCSIEGSFRKTCEETVRVIRERREAVMSILEIFIREPITSGGFFDTIPKNEVISGSIEINKWMIESKGKKRLKEIISRISNKINGYDFENTVQLPAWEQVDALIKAATDQYNLSYLYHGWNPFW